ncbi:hypothetical protein VNO77_16714 [Canavalia gladiata]|uniref:Uncharacterized protein n=1 Tax=Canavalia gladiata TaxID=3824 RepID=A0AAN9LHW3_CANGL
MPLTEIKIDPQHPFTFPHMNQFSSNLTIKSRSSKIPPKIQTQKVGLFGIKIKSNQNPPFRSLQLKGNSIQADPKIEAQDLELEMLKCS